MIKSESTLIGEKSIKTKVSDVSSRYCVFSTGTDAYIPHAVVSLMAFKKHNNSYDMFVLCSEIGEENRQLCEYCDVTPIEMDLSDIFYMKWEYPKECFYHFKGPELFSLMGYEYSVYLDGDIYCNNELNIDATERFHIAGSGYDTNKEFFTEIGQYESVIECLNIKNIQGFDKRRIQSGIIIYNNNELRGIEYFRKAGELYHRSIENGVPRKGDDSLLSLMTIVYPEIRTKHLSKYHNLIDWKTTEMDLVDDDIFAKCVLYHFAAQKPWFSFGYYCSYPHKVFVEKWIEVMVNKFTQEDIKRCYPEKYRKDLIKSEDIDFFWFSVQPPNFGDWVTPYLLKKVCNREVKTPVDPTKVKKCIIISTGSIMRLCGANTIVWGSGIRDRYQDIKPGKLIRSVRGPLTRTRLLEVGGECPPIYGDPALLLPRVYRPTGIEKKYALGITPHISQYDKVRELYENEEGVEVIDLRTTNIERIVDRMLECDKIASSSLHGIIAANAYNIPVRWIQFDNNVFGDNTKYYDHYESIGRENESYIDACFYKKIAVEKLLEQIRPYKVRIDLDKLWDAGIFFNGEISKYIRYRMTPDAVS